MGRFFKICLSIMAAALLFGCGQAAADPVQTSAPAQTTAPTVTEAVTTAPTEPAGPTLSVFLQTAILPVGNTMYVWGGGWNEADTGAGIEAVSLGVSPRWAEFAATQTAAYDYNTTRYQIHDGLDCSGYVGWAVYNTLETENGQEGYVGKATEMAKTFSQLGLGTYIPASKMTRWQPGDIMSMKGHVWISLGMCADGSVLLVHASPPGVILSGTELKKGKKSEAILLAQELMQTYYPDWYSRFPDCSRSSTYLKNASAMRWTALDDPEGFASMTAPEVAQLLWNRQ